MHNKEKALFFAKIKKAVHQNISIFRVNIDLFLNVKLKINFKLKHNPRFLRWYKN